MKKKKAERKRSLQAWFLEVSFGGSIKKVRGDGGGDMAKNGDNSCSS